MGLPLWLGISERRGRAGRATLWVFAVLEGTSECLCMTGSGTKAGGEEGVVGCKGAEAGAWGILRGGGGGIAEY